MQPVNEPDFKGYFYAHIPSLDLTTHGVGIEGALKAAQELVEAWLAEKRARGETVPTETNPVIAQVAMHPGTLPTGTFRKILKQAGLSEDDFGAL